MPQKLSDSDDDVRLSKSGIRGEMSKHRFGLIMIAKIVYNQLAATQSNVQPKDCEPDLIDALEVSRPGAAIFKAVNVANDPVERKKLAGSMARAMLDDAQDWSDIIT